MCGGQLITAPTCNFLRVSAQMYNLDKQKTASSRKTLPVMCRDIENEKTFYHNNIVFIGKHHFVRTKLRRLEKNSF